MLARCPDRVLACRLGPPRPLSPAALSGRESRSQTSTSICCYHEIIGLKRFRGPLGDHWQSAFSSAVVQASQTLPRRLSLLPCKSVLECQQWLKVNDG